MGIRQQQGEKWADYIARLRAAQQSAPKRDSKPRRKRRRRADDDDTPFGQGDNLGESPDY